MGSRGPVPKDPSRRARPNAAMAEVRVLEVRPQGAPDLPSLRIEDPETGIASIQDWPEATILWWQAWVESPLTDHWTGVDWSFMLDTAYLHARFWMGETKHAAELRLRLAKLGVTAEDRARLRIQFAQADEADDKREGRKPPRRHAGLKLAN